jgi:hypothetical protein
MSAKHYFRKFWRDANDNIVNMHFVFNDHQAFMAMKARFPSVQAQFKEKMAMQECSGLHSEFIKSGVLMRRIFEEKSSDERLIISLDYKDCALISLPALADAKTLAGLARTVAASENAQPAARLHAGLRFENATAVDASVEVRLTALEIADVADTTKRNFLRGTATGIYCTAYHGFIFQGGTIHQIYVQPDGKPLMDRTINRSEC